jgi:hypothetical protein
MNRFDLEGQLKLLGVNDSEYSLWGELKSDSIVIIHNYNKWEVFYFDERGGRNDEFEFKSEDEACSYVYKLFIDAKEVQLKFGIKL